MTPVAVIMMIITFVMIWGGLIAAVISLRRHPEQPDD
ncbi:MAG TPA: methionine/alanine import family NSS transporter small subunit [Candidatus Stackebrandtia excrementipullorum]|nr:methionine/alanine import family NSS transporter small subunit [Candidatus Stackebrandtia excrementipullorum]